MQVHAKDEHDLPQNDSTQAELTKSQATKSNPAPAKTDASSPEALLPQKDASPKANSSTKVQASSKVDSSNAAASTLLAPSQSTATAADTATDATKTVASNTATGVANTAATDTETVASVAKAAADESRPASHVFKHFSPKSHDQITRSESQSLADSSQKDAAYTKPNSRPDSALTLDQSSNKPTGDTAEQRSNIARAMSANSTSTHSISNDNSQSDAKAKATAKENAKDSTSISHKDQSSTITYTSTNTNSAAKAKAETEDKAEPTNKADAGTEAKVGSKAETNAKAEAKADTKGTSSHAQDEAAVYDGAEQSQDNQTNRPQRKNVFLRSLQFRIIWIVTLAGLVSMTIMSVLSHNKITKSTHDFVDEELSQIASVAINYRMIIPRRWEAPRHYHDRVMRLMQTPDGSIIMQLSVDREAEMRELAQMPAQWFNEQERQANAQAEAGNAANNNTGNARPNTANAANSKLGRGQGGPGRGMGPGQGMGQGRGMGQGQGMGNAQNLSNWANQTSTPSLSDLSNLNYDIMIAPLYGRPGDALYIPLGVSDGFYTVMVADERVRAFVATNANGQRFVVARPLSSLLELMRQSFYASFLQFFLIDLIAIPLIIILSINFMLRSLNRVAQDLYHRSDEDLSPVVTNDGRQKCFIPSELDGFIISINRLFQRVDESMQSKRRFIADAAHEMRTQSTVLSLQIAALDNEELPPSAQVKLKRLKEGIAREKSLMTSLLTLAREQGCVDLSLERINIFELYTKLIEEQGLVADNKNIDLGVDGEVNYTIVSDRSKLTRIMSNLLSNAIKYTPQDGRIDLKAQTNADGSLTLTVQDDGPGIPPEHLKHILEPFYRVDGDRSAVQGTGLGLAIVKASCDSLKAQLRFANATPHGLIASVTLKDMPAPEGDNKASPRNDHKGDKSEQAEQKH